MADIAAVGPEAGVLGFLACGIKIFPVKNTVDARGILKKIAGEYSIILLEESFAAELEDLLEGINSSIILPLPMLGRSTGRAKERIYRFIRRAIGAPESML